MIIGFVILLIVGLIGLGAALSPSPTPTVNASTPTDSFTIYKGQIFSVNNGYNNIYIGRNPYPFDSIVQTEQIIVNLGTTYENKITFFVGDNLCLGNKIYSTKWEAFGGITLTPVK